MSQGRTVTDSNGNVFRDLDLPCADERKEIARLRWMLGVVRQDLTEGAPDRARRFLDHQLAIQVPKP